MKREILIAVLMLGSVPGSWGQANGDGKLVKREEIVIGGSSYTVLGATPQQEELVRTQIQVMQPEVLPLRIIFVPHWKYVETARIFQLHVPAGYTSTMFTHLASRSVFIDRDRYVSDDSLGYWVAHELGHLAAHSAGESDADKAARELRIRLKNKGKTNAN